MHGSGQDGELLILGAQKGTSPTPGHLELKEPAI